MTAIPNWPGPEYPVRPAELASDSEVDSEGWHVEVHVPVNGDMGTTQNPVIVDMMPSGENETAYIAPQSYEAGEQGAL
jgi:hypothetical protein